MRWTNARVAILVVTGMFLGAAGALIVAGMSDLLEPRARGAITTAASGLGLIAMIGVVATTVMAPSQPPGGVGRQ